MPNKENNALLSNRLLQEMEASRQSALGFSNSLGKVRYFGKDDLRNYQQEVLDTNYGSQSQRETTSKQLEINNMILYGPGNHAESVNVVPIKKQKKSAFKFGRIKPVEANIIDRASVKMSIKKASYHVKLFTPFFISPE